MSERLKRARLAWRLVVETLKHEPFTDTSKLAAEIRGDVDTMFPQTRDDATKERR